MRYSYLALILAASQAFLQSAPAGDARPVMFVRVPEKPCWQDMAYLSAVPAITVAGDGAPAVVALGGSGEVTREVADYLRRYRPTSACALGAPIADGSGAVPKCRTLPADSADSAAIVLARTYWPSCATAVVCREDGYADALVAATLASRLRAPLLFAGEKGLSRAAMAELKRLAARRVILIGAASNAGAAMAKQRMAVTRLADAKAVLAWMRKGGLRCNYVAAVNANDRSRTVVKKLSLSAALLAAARGGMVVPLAYDVLWKAGFTGEDCRKNPPKGIPASKAPPRKGQIALDGRRYPFVVTAEAKNRRCRLNLDLNGNGVFNDAGEGPFATGDVVTLGRKPCAVSLGSGNGPGKADVRLTWPTAAQVQRDLRAHYDAAGGAPEHLCIVGFLDAIPQAVIRDNASSPTDLPSDLPYADVDDDPFAEIAVARLVAENASLGTLYASRVITYGKLLDGPWRRGVGEARWENTYGKLFENVGFRKSFRHDRQDLQWLVKPAGGTKGKRAREFDANSPLANVAAMTHMAHSWWKDLGQTFTWDSPVLLAPVLVESGGCLTAVLDRDPNCRSVIARLLRNGAVGFVGNGRPGIAHQELLRLEFWNGVLAGKTIGQAHRMALNSTVATVLTDGQTKQGPFRYQLYIRTLFGDPAFAMKVPSKPRSAPAHVTVKGDVVSVHPPAEWWPVKMRVPEDWKKWADKDLYVCRGAGTYALRHWCGRQYDKEVTCYTAEIRTARRIKAIRQVQSPPKPLGWSGTYHVDEHADGTRSYRWRVQLIDFDQIKGKIVSKVDRLDYRIEWQPADG